MGTPHSQPIKRHPPGAPAHLSFAQQRLWFLNQLEEGGSVYNLPQAWHVTGSLDVSSLERSIKGVLARHQALRASFVGEQGVPIERITSDVSFTLPVVDLGEWPASERQMRAQQLMTEEARRPFDLGHGPLIRALLLRLGESEYEFLLVMHHIVSDVWSFGVLRRELGAFYKALSAGLTPASPVLQAQYQDFAYWQRQWIKGEVLESQLDYWKQHLVGALPLFQLPTDHPRPAVQIFHGANKYLVLPKTLSDALHALSLQEGASLFMTLLAVYCVLLHKHTGQEDILVGVPIANRTRVEFEDLIGLFINTLVLRTDLSGNLKFRDVLARVREVALGAYAHQDLPFEKLVEELHPERDLSFNPLFQVMFVLRNTPLRPLELQGTAVSPLEVETNTSMFDLTLYMTDAPEGLTACFEYNTDLFEDATIERMAGHLQTLLEGVVADPGRRISDLPLLPDAEVNRILVQWNATEADYPKESCIHELIEAQAAATPDAVSVVCGDRSLAYRDLNNRANQVARRLRKHGVGPEVLVGICVERSLDMMVALLGILKAGGAYMPLDPGFPSARLSLILEDARASVLVTQRHLMSVLPAYAGKVLYIDDPEIALESEQNPEIEMKSSNLAYVMFTSGSTGRPKGVQIEHRAVVNLLESMGQKPGLTAEDVLLAVTTLSFDIAGLELFLPLVKGAQVVIAGRDVAADGRQLGELLESSGATVMQATPATWQMLLVSGWAGRKEMKILCGGEALPPELARKLIPRCLSLWNMYGPTETTIWSMIWEVIQSDGAVMIGRPIANTRVYVLDRFLKPVPIGVAGELFIGGDGLARGYLNGPELTAGRFIADPFRPGSDSRLYKTGDLCRWREDGNVEHLGRLDHQVKIRGYRIELGDVETALCRHPDVKEAVVVVQERAVSEKELIAYLVAHHGRSPHTEDLRQHLKDWLPDYMVPSAFMVLDKMPLTPNGKVDRLALPKPGTLKKVFKTLCVAPRDELELQVAGIWRSVLKVGSISVEDDFFALGGNSLLAAQLFARIERVMGKRIPLAMIFRASTVKQFAGMLRQKEWKPNWSSLVPVQPGGSKPPLFLCHGAEGNVLLYRDLALCLGPDQPVYGLQSQGLDGSKDFPRCLEHMATLYVAEMRSLQPEGPYYLGGYCMGGAVSFEMAQQLHAQGQKVALIALLETYNICSNPKALSFPYRCYHWIQTLKFHLQNFLMLSREDAFAFFRRKARVQRARIKAALLIWFFTRFARFRTYKGSVYPHVSLARVNDRAFAQYRPRAFSGRLVLFRPKKNYAGLDDLEFGWSAIAGDGVDVQCLPVNPRGMLVQPFVRLLAEKLKACLEKAQEDSE